MKCVKGLTLSHLKVNNMDIKRIILITICFVFFLNIYANVEPFGIDDDGWIVSVSNSDVDGLYRASTGSLELTYKNDAKDIQVLIYRDGRLILKSQPNYVFKNEVSEIRLSDYGPGIYTIVTIRDGKASVAGTIACKK